MSKKNKGVYLAILVLVLLVGLLSYLNGAGKAKNPDMIQIIKNEQGVAQVTMAELKKLPVVEKQIVLNSSIGKEEYLFTGTLLKEVFLMLDSGFLDGAREVISKSIDGYTVAFKIEEILADDQVLLVYLADGLPLGSKNSGGTGPFRIIAPQDPFAQRAGKFVVELEVR